MKEINYKTALIIAGIAIGCFRLGVSRTESKYHDEIRRIKLRVQNFQ